MLHTRSNHKTIFFERFSKALSSYNIFLPGCKQIHAENPGGNFLHINYEKGRETVFYFAMKAVSLELLWNYFLFESPLLDTKNIY